jgi:prepilin-type N-terminal cleavage/methylation domain-containing protein
VETPTSLLSKFSARRRQRLRGFSLVELIVVLGLIVVGAGVGTAVVSKVQTAAMDAKLVEDVDQVNTAISLYMTGGGTLAGVTDPQAVVDRLKTVTTTEDGNDREIMFAKRSMIDQRLAVVTSEDSSQRGMWKWSRLHARYNATTQRFEVVGQASDETFRGFALDDARGTDLISSERRDMVFRQAKNDPWVWDFDPSSNSAPTNLPTGVAGTDTTAAVNPPAALTGAVRAQPPTFNPEPPQEVLNDYPLSIELGNPNNDQVTRILYHLEPGQGLDMPYNGPITVDPGTKIVAFVQTLDQTVYLDSETANRTYVPDPVVPQLNDSLAPTYTYLEAGGTLAGGSPTPTPADPARITLANGNDIPNLYENESGFRVYWTYDGSDPRESATLTQGTGFFESYPGDIVPVRVSDFGDEPEMTFKYYAKAHNTNAFARPCPLDPGQHHHRQRTGQHVCRCQHRRGPHRPPDFLHHRRR